jgi:hypothetical protein
MEFDDNASFLAGIKVSNYFETKLSFFLNKHVVATFALNAHVDLFFIRDRPGFCCMLIVLQEPEKDEINNLLHPLQYYNRLYAPCQRNDPFHARSHVH